jgi:ABC-type branched-subunit amino acid transport system substrate-binding protein
MKKITKKMTAALAFLLVATMLLAACNGGNGNGGAGDPDAPRSQGITDDTIRIGLTFPQSGWAAFFGVPIVDAAQAEINRANARGGFDGKQVELFVHDCGGDVVAGHLLFEQMVEVDEVFAIIGMSGGQAAMTLDYLLDFGIPIVNVTGGMGTFYRQYDPEYRVFNVQPSNTADAPLLLSLALATPVYGPNRDQYLPDDAMIGFMTGATDAGFEYAEYLMSLARELGIEDRVIVEYVTADVYATVIQQFIDAGVGVVINASMDGMGIVAAMYDAGWYVPIFNAYGMSTITSFSPVTYHPQRPIFATIWAEDTSPAALAWLADMRESLNYLDRLSDAERDGYIDNGFARAGNLMGQVLVIGLQRMVDLGLDWTWENFVVAMEHAPFSLGGTPTFSFEGGRRMGVESLALWEFWVDENGEPEVGIIGDFMTVEEILAPWRARTGN